MNDLNKKDILNSFKENKNKFTSKYLVNSIGLFSIDVVVSI